MNAPSYVLESSDPKISFDQFQSQRYRPRNLIVLLPDLKGEDALKIMDIDQKSEGVDQQKVLAETIKQIFELHTLQTSVMASEDHRTGLIRNNIQVKYSQGFTFAERRDKVIYNSARRWRDERPLNALRFMMIEPDHTFTKAVDAWELVGVIDRVFNEVIPTRDLKQLPGTVFSESTDEQEKLIAAVSRAEVFHTTVVVTGTLTHTLDVLREGQSLIEQMNRAGMSPNKD